MVTQRGYYAPVRMGERGEWISPSEISCDRPTAEVTAELTEKRCGADWAKYHPVQRIARITIVEIED